MTLRTYWNADVLEHEPPDGAFKLPSAPFLAVDEPHPDQPERVRNIKEIIEYAFDSDGSFELTEPASRDAVESIHDPEYLSWLEEFCEDGGGYVDKTTTAANEATFEAALAAAGTAIAATEYAVGSGSDVPYGLVRPSGHHAQSDRPDGFCFCNNGAVATQRVLDTGLDRVAIVDWDVHHGNGTQEIFEDRDDVLFVSIHNEHGAWHPEYHPQTGGLEEVGFGDGEGYTVNIPVPPGTGDQGYESVFEQLVEPIVTEFDPDLIVYSAGQDIGPSDPLGRNVVTRAGFRMLGERARRLADRTTDGDFVILQEGGYQISHLAVATLGVLEGATGTVKELERYGDSDPFAWLDEEIEPLERALESARERHSEYWSV
jgi:acetoin utilization deacetylase AcuC-like enzyme